MIRVLAPVLLLAAVLAGCLGAPAEQEAPTVGIPPLEPFPVGTDVGTTRVFTRVGDPGHPEGIAVDGDRVYVGAATNATPGAVLVHNLTTGAHLRTIQLEKPPVVRGLPEGVLGVTVDASGRLYVLDLAGARVVRFDPRDEVPEQETYAELPDIPPCSAATLGACSPTADDDPPLPNHLAFGPDGSLYVSDSFQATIWRIPPGGGEPEAWFQDARMDGFGANGVAVSPGDRFLYVAQTVMAYAGSVPLPRGAGNVPLAVPAGEVLRLPLVASPGPADLERVKAYPDGAVDGLTFGASGRIYVCVIDLGFAGAETPGPGISVLAPDGTEERFFPEAGANDQLEVPYHVPASVAFHDEHRSLLVTNLARLPGGPPEPDHWAVLEAFVDDTGHPLHRPEVP